MTSPFRVAVVGSGPSGIYAADAVLKQLPAARIDVIDRDLSPYGLVRYGVAPDHPKIKSVVRVLARTLESERVNWYGNVTVGDRDEGADLDLADLRSRYHAVILATGAPRGRRLEVPGGHLAGSCTAAELVAWYNARPDGAPPAVGTARSVIVLGAGNVALDIARVLVKGADGALADTDVPDEVLDALRALDATEVHIVARRGPEHAKFGLAELRDLAALPGLDLRAELADFPAATDADPAPLAQLRAWAESPPTRAGRAIVFHFHREIARIDGDGRVASARLVSTASASAPNRRDIAADLVVAAIGHRSEPMPGVPFSHDRGHFVHDAGRVVPGLYVVGWAKRGAQGVIGTNKVDATETVASLVADAAQLGTEPVEIADLGELLRSRHAASVCWDDWLRLDAEELARGLDRGRARTKLPGRAAVLELLGADDCCVDREPAVSRR